MTLPYPATALEPEVAAPLILALPKGRILAECGALLARAGVSPAPDYADEESRRLRFPRDMSANACAQRIRRLPRLQHPDLRDARSCQGRCPSLLHFEIGGAQPGLLAHLAHQVARKIDACAVDVASIRNSGRKVDPPGIGGMGGHDAEHIGAIAAAHGAHGKAVLHRRITKAPLPPGEHAGRRGA